MKIFLIIFLIVSSVSNASNISFSIGVDLFDAVSKNDLLNRKQSAFESPLKSFNRISGGITLKPFEVSELRLTYRTNSLLNFGEMYETQGGQIISSQIKSQSYIVSHPISRTLLPFVVVSDITSITTIGSANSIVTNGFMYGVGITYVLNKSHGFSLTYFLPSDTFQTQYALGVSYSYFFDSFRVM